MKTILAIACLMLAGCAGLPATQPKLTVEWPSDREPRGEVDVVELLEQIEYGRRSDGVVVWRTNLSPLP